MSGRRAAGGTSRKMAAQPRCLRSHRSPVARTPVLAAAIAQLHPGGDDELVARRAQLLDGLQRQDPAEGLAPALRPRTVGPHGDDLAVGERTVRLHDITVVLKSIANEMGEKGARVAARCECRLHGWVLLRSGERERRLRLPPGAPAAAPLPAETLLSVARGRQLGNVGESA